MLKLIEDYSFWKTLIYSPFTPIFQKGERWEGRGNRKWHNGIGGSGVIGRGQNVKSHHEQCRKNKRWNAMIFLSTPPYNQHSCHKVQPPPTPPPNKTLFKLRVSFVPCPQSRLQITTNSQFRISWFSTVTTLEQKNITGTIEKDFRLLLLPLTIGMRMRTISIQLTVISRTIMSNLILGNAASTSAFP